ncbi:MAG TPA: cupin domain-containing protein [Steroidobacteraceae bacterium]|jgi:uncharacterized cupin superfamily protein|nr:cupin domain-containing protein [Steroidobacteraceae bacterium]
MKKISIEAIEPRYGSGYPKPFDEPCRQRSRRALGDAAGLTDFGVNVLELSPGTWSSQRHWHSKEDEFVWVLEGKVVLVSEHGEEILDAGDCVGFKAGDPNGHHFQNRSDGVVRLLEVGSRHLDDVSEYPDIDLRWGGPTPTHKDGCPY